MADDLELDLGMMDGEGACSLHLDLGDKSPIESEDNKSRTRTNSEDSSISENIQNAFSNLALANPEGDEDEEVVKSGYRMSLIALQKASLEMHDKNPEISEELAQQLEKELEESLEDLWEMRNYIVGRNTRNFAKKPTKKKRKLVEIENLKVISWDLGMLSYQYMGTRAEAIADLILKGNFDLVFLQEVNRIVYNYLRCRLEDKYSSNCGRNDVGIYPDFVATFIRLDTVAEVSHKVIYFERTRERRSLLKTEVMIGNAKVCLLNTHLESMLGNSLYRMQQLKKCFSIFQSVDSCSHVIFCGSLNIRDWELRKLKIPHNLIDMWLRHGNSKNQYTWDLKINPLIQMPESVRFKSGQPRKRFGRIYFRHGAASVLEPRSFDLIGKDIVAAGKYYASDHWALVSDFSIDKKCYEKKATDEGQANNASPPRSRADLLEGEDEENEAKIEPEVKDSWDDSD